MSDQSGQLRFRYRTLWLVMGWALVLAIVYLSLTPHPIEIQVEEGDKMGHLLAYGTLMLWFAQLYDTTKDWSQAHDLAKQMPEKVAELKQLFEFEAMKYNVFPLDDRKAERAAWGLDPHRGRGSAQGAVGSQGGGGRRSRRARRQ